MVRQSAKYWALRVIRIGIAYLTKLIVFAWRERNEAVEFPSKPFLALAIASGSPVFHALAGASGSL
jgi:hypothetical protein